MTSVERRVDRLLAVLRETIVRSRFTQLEIQEALGWGRTYISQLWSKQKHVRFDQVAMILGVIGVEPAEFYAEVFPPPKRPEAPSPRIPRRARAAASADQREVRRLAALLDGLVFVLEQKNLITARELERAVEAAEQELH